MILEFEEAFVTIIYDLLDDANYANSNESESRKDDIDNVEIC